MTSEDLRQVAASPVVDVGGHAATHQQLSILPEEDQRAEIVGGRRALDRYAEGPASHALDALNEPTARAAVERLLYTSVDAMTDAHNPRGCLLVQGALACGDEARTVKRELLTRREAGEEALCQRLKRAKSGGDLPLDSDPVALARYVTTVIHGMAVQAAGGVGRAELRKTVEIALRAWPN